LTEIFATNSSQDQTQDVAGAIARRTRAHSNGGAIHPSLLIVVVGDCLLRHESNRTVLFAVSARFRLLLSGICSKNVLSALVYFSLLSV
jgi:hypothetical protein